MSSEKIRVLVCHTDGAVYELPDYEGPADRDDTLKYRLAGHENHIGNLFRYEKSQWNKSTYRKAILDEIAKQVRPGQGTGFGAEYYDLKNNFQQDAIDCWKSYGKTTNPGHCEYMQDSKRLYPDTKGERKDLGLDPNDRPNTFLCDFCPVHSLVMQKKRKKAGLYN